MTLVSIVVPVFNAEKHVSTCLDSILSQTLHNFEIICINDGSTDNSLNILEYYAKEDKRIKILTQENSGPGKARNLGIANAKGSLITFIDADDCFSNKNALMNLVRAQKKYNSDIVVGKISLIKANNDKQLKVRGWSNVEPYRSYNISELYNNLFQSVSTPIFAKLFKKEIILNNNIRFHDYRASEDMLFVYTYLLNCKTLIFIKDFIINYKVFQEDSLSSFNSSNFMDCSGAYLDLKHLIQEKKMIHLLRKTLLISYIFCIGYVLKRVSFCNKIKIARKFMLSFKELL